MCTFGNVSTPALSFSMDLTFIQCEVFPPMQILTAFSPLCVNVELEMRFANFFATVQPPSGMYFSFETLQFDHFQLTTAHSAVDATRFVDFMGNGDKETQVLLWSNVESLTIPFAYVDQSDYFEDLTSRNQTGTICAFSLLVGNGSLISSSGMLLRHNGEVYCQVQESLDNCSGRQSNVYLFLA